MKLKVAFTYHHYLSNHEYRLIKTSKSRVTPNWNTQMWYPLMHCWIICLICRNALSQAGSYCLAQLSLVGLPKGCHSRIPPRGRPPQLPVKEIPLPTSRAQKLALHKPQSFHQIPQVVLVTQTTCKLCYQRGCTLIVLWWLIWFMTVQWSCRFSFQEPDWYPILLHRF